MRAARSRRAPTIGVTAFIALAVIAYVVISRWFLGTAIVHGDSMVPTMNSGDRCLVNKFVYALRDPLRGEIVCFRRPGEDYLSVKRIVALPGERIRIKDGRMWVRGEPLDEPYLPEWTADTSPKRLGTPVYEVAPASYFVLGDNRRGSADSRDFGAVHKGWITGRVMLVF